jgi:non-specific serine/threonine protein kinase
MDAEYDNLRAAFEWIVSERPYGHSLGALLPTLSIHWIVSGSLDEGGKVLDRVLQIETKRTKSRARALVIVAWLAINQGDPDRAQLAATEARVLAAEAHDELTFAYANLSLGAAGLATGDIDAAERYFSSALEESRRDSYIATSALRGLAAIAGRRHDLQLQRDYLRHGIEISQRCHESWECAATLSARAVSEWERGAVSQAWALAADSLRLRHQFGDRIGMAQAVEILAWCSAGQRNFAAAARLLRVAETIRRDVGSTLATELTHHHTDCEQAIASQLGQQPAELAGAELVGLGLDQLLQLAMDDRPAPSQTATRKADSALTRREHEIADLVAEGLSNREIAARVVISQRTAEGHIEHILTKLGFTSRVQIAAWVVEQRHSVKAEN